jgi:CRP-like cAMP-binding protein
MKRIRQFFQRFFDSAPLPQEVTDALALLCTHTVFRPNDIIFEQGENVSAFFWIQQGNVELRHSGSTLKILHQNALMGEDVVFDGAMVYDYAAVALTDVEAIKVDADGFMALVQQHPALGLQLLKAVSKESLNTFETDTTPLGGDDETSSPHPFDFIPQGFIPNWGLAVSKAVRASAVASQSLQFFMFSD